LEFPSLYIDSVTPPQFLCRNASGKKQSIILTAYYMTEAEAHEEV
jgi:hypothetical protein